jgi:hypothetical protein
MGAKMKISIVTTLLILASGHGQAAVKQTKVPSPSGQGEISVQVQAATGAVWIDWNSTMAGSLAWSETEKVFISANRCADAAKFAKNLDRDHSPMPTVNYRFQVLQNGLMERPFLGSIGVALGLDKAATDKLFVSNELEYATGSTRLEWSSNSYVSAVGTKALARAEEEIASAFLQQAPSLGKNSTIFLANDNYLIYCDVVLGHLKVSYTYLGKSNAASKLLPILSPQDITKLNKGIHATGKPQPSQKYTWSSQQDEATIFAGVILGFQLAKQVPNIKLQSIFVEDTLALYDAMFSVSDLSARVLTKSEVEALSQQMQPTGRDFETIEIKINEFKNRGFK